MDRLRDAASYTLPVASITSFWSRETDASREQRAAEAIAARFKGLKQRSDLTKRTAAAIKVQALVRGRQAKRASWERAKELKTLAAAGLDESTLLGSDKSTSDARRIVSAVFYDRPIGLGLRDAGGKTKVATVQGLAAAQGVPIGAEVIEVNEENVVGMGKDAVAALVATSSLPLEIRLDVTETKAASVHYFSFPKGYIGIGLVFPSDGRVVVASVDRDSLAAERGVTVGSELLEINRETVQGLGKDETMDRISGSARPIAMKFDVAGAASNVITTTFGEGAVGLGLQFPADGRVVVSTVAPGSHAERQGVPIGSALLDINKNPVKGLGKEIVLRMVAAAARPMFVRLDITGGKIVEAEFPSDALGLQLSFPASGQILVSGVVPGSSAAEQEIQVGSALIEVNNVSLNGRGKDAVLAILETAQRPLHAKFDISGGSIFVAKFGGGPLGLSFDFPDDGRVVVKDLDERGPAAAKGVTVGSALLHVNDLPVARVGEEGVLEMIAVAPRPLTLRFDLTGGLLPKANALDRIKRAPSVKIEEPPASPVPRRSLVRQKSKTSMASNRVRRLSLAADRVDRIEKRVQQELRMSIAPSTPNSVRSRANTGDLRASLSTRSGFSEVSIQIAEEDNDATSADVDENVEPDLEAKATLTQADLDAWTRWAIREAHVRLEAENVHPRMQQHVGRGEERKLKSLPLPLTCTLSDLMKVMGVGVRLYFDTIRFLGGFMFLGACCSIPSYFSSLANLDEGAYADEPLQGIYQLALISMGVRVRQNDPAYGDEIGCDTRTCHLMNSLAAVLEVLYCILFFYASRAFLRYAQRLAQFENDENATIEDYSMMIYGFQGLQKFEPELVRTHVEGSIRTYAQRKIELCEKRMKKVMRENAHFTRLGMYFQYQKAKWNEFLADGCEKVADITLIADDKGLLRELVKLAPLEELVPTLKNKVVIAEKMGNTSGWGVWCQIYKLRRAARPLARVRGGLDHLAEMALRPVGAFVTFNWERTREVALDIWGPSPLGIYSAIMQPSYARLSVERFGRPSSRLLKAYDAPRPMDVRYENLPKKFAYTTKARRCCACCVMAAIIIIGMIIVLIGVLVKNEADTTFARLISSGGNATSAATTNATDATVYTTCTEEERQLIDTLGDPISFIMDFAAQNDAGTANDHTIMLLSALLRCYAVPLMTTATSLVIVVVNALLVLALNGLLRFSRFPTLTERHKAQVIGLFIAQSLNTGIILFIVNTASGPTVESGGFVRDDHLCFLNTTNPAHAGTFEQFPVLEFFHCIAGPHGIFLRGSHFDLSPRWYADVGISLKQTLVIILGTRFLTPTLKALIGRYTRPSKAKKVRTLERMKILYTGPEPILPELLGKMYTFVFLCLIFSTPLPALYMLGCIYLLLVYLFDKWYLLRVCKKPVPYSHKFISSTLWWLQWAILLKLALAIWSYGSLPGVLLSEAIEIAADAATAAASAVGQGTASVGQIASTTSQWLTQVTECTDDCSIATFVLQRMQTVGSLTLGVGLCILVALMFLHLFFWGLANLFIWDWIRAFWALISCRKKGEQLTWPPENPTFTNVIEGHGENSRVRVAREADETGRGEVLVLESDVDSNCCANCKGPMDILLYLFGLKTIRKRIRSMEKFRELPKKMTTISGKANMSYAPHFMPLYEAAFRYAEEHQRPEAPAKAKTSTRMSNLADLTDSQMSDIGASSAVADPESHV